MQIPINRFLSILLTAAFLGSLVFTVVYSAESQDEEYIIFGKYKKFEPSGIARIPNSNDYIIINDKKSSLSIFELTKEGRLDEKMEIDLIQDSKKIKLKKLEGITASLKDPGTFYAITAFDRKEEKYRKLVRFSLEESNKKEDQENENAKVFTIYDPP